MLLGNLKLMITNKDKVALPGIKDDVDKLDWSLLPFATLHSVIKVLMFGAKKYSRDNWKLVPDAKRRYFSATIRHLDAYQDGDKCDKETGLSHLAHAICCLIFLLWFDDKGE